jgi:hypothetical protein
MAEESTLGLSVLTGTFVIVSLLFIWYRSTDPFVGHITSLITKSIPINCLQIDAIPTVGYSGPILSYLSAFRYSFLDGQSMIKQGYEKVMALASSVYINLCKLMLL